MWQLYIKFPLNILFHRASKPASRSSIWISMNVMFTPATANGYSHKDRSPSCFRRRSWNDFCNEYPETLGLKNNNRKHICIFQSKGSYVKISMFNFHLITSAFFFPSFLQKETKSRLQELKARWEKVAYREISGKEQQVLQWYKTTTPRDKAQ